MDAEWREDSRALKISRAFGSRKTTKSRKECQSGDSAHLPVSRDRQLIRRYPRLEAWAKGGKEFSATEGQGGAGQKNSLAKQKIVTGRHRSGSLYANCNKDQRSTAAVELGHCWPSEHHGVIAHQPSDRTMYNTRGLQSGDFRVC
jgi:hypothetical protein